MSHCKKYTFYGRVQGVGFRATTAQIAARYEVTGTVRNCANGSVELLICGTNSVVQQFLQELQQTLDRYIERVEMDDLEPEISFEKFRIVRDSD